MTAVLTAVLTAEQWAPIRDAVMEYGNHFAEAALHQSSSKADISHASALSALRKVRDSIDALLALVQPAAHSLISHTETVSEPGAVLKVDRIHLTEEGKRDGLPPRHSY